ncbi:MAG: phosphoribosyltransferase family protein [Bacteroidota bacterium]
MPPADAATLALRFSKLPAPPPFVYLGALWTYDEQGTVARLQQRLKYGNRPHLGEALGRWLAQAVPAATYDLVLPVPLHRQRTLERGYNQSACLARGLAAERDLDCSDSLLIRARPTRSQTKLGHGARWTNVHGAFTLTDASGVRGRHVLLVDDVITTGATLAAAAQPLVSAGATVTVSALACTREYV